MKIRWWSIWKCRRALEHCEEKIVSCLSTMAALQEENKRVSTENLRLEIEVFKLKAQNARLQEFLTPKRTTTKRTPKV